MPDDRTIKYEIWNGRKKTNRKRIEYKPSFQWNNLESGSKKPNISNIINSNIMHERENVIENPNITILLVIRDQDELGISMK